MFWKHNTSTQIAVLLLAKEDVTIQEIMDSEDIINECRQQNKLLIEFLQKTEIMEELITLITQEPSLEIEERSRFKYPNVACELLTCDVPALNEKLASDKVLLDKLYSFLESDPPLNPLLASYFSKVMGALIAKKTEQVLDFLKAKDTFISLLLKHLGTSAIMDLMLKLMTQVEGIEMNQNILNWLDSQSIVQSLVSLLNPNVDKERHYNVAQLLCDFIRIARDNQKNSVERVDPDPLLNTLESSETVSLLLDYILSGEEKSESAIVGGIQVIISLLDFNQSNVSKFSSTQNLYGANMLMMNNDEICDDEHKLKSISNTTRVIKDRIKQFHDLLVDPPKQDPVLTTVGTLDPPLGNIRLQVTKLFSALISTNDQELLKEIETTETLSLLLDLFFKYQWNNFLHTQVENCLIGALKTHSSEESDENSNALTKYLLTKCKIIERILNAWKENDEQQSQVNGIRKGYMGHLISIMNKIVNLCNNSLGQYLKDNLPEVAKSLDEFKDTTLDETNKIQETLLGGAHPNSSIDNNDDYGDIPLPQSSALQQQMFFQYQMQNLSSPFIEGYSGFSDDAFNDGNDTLQSIEPRVEMNFDLSEGDLVQQQEIFKQVCAQSINTLDDADDQIFDDKEHTFQTVIEKNDRNEPIYSSDSDEELPNGDEDNMEVDPWTSPKVTDEAKSDPWNANFVAGQNEDTVGGWADFSSVQFDANTTEKDETKPEQQRVEEDLKIENVDKGEEIKVESERLEVVAVIEECSVKSAAGDRAGSTDDMEKKVEQSVIVEQHKSVAGDSDSPVPLTDQEKSEKEEKV